jgi:hypothetical protein
VPPQLFLDLELRFDVNLVACSSPLLTHIVATLPLEYFAPAASSVHTTLYDYAAVESGSLFWNHSLLDSETKGWGVYLTFRFDAAASPTSLKGSMTTIFLEKSRPSLSNKKQAKNIHACHGPMVLEDFPVRAEHGVSVRWLKSIMFWKAKKRNLKKPNQARWRFSLSGTNDESFLSSHGSICGLLESGEYASNEKMDDRPRGARIVFQDCTRHMWS